MQGLHVKGIGVNTMFIHNFVFLIIKFLDKMSNGLLWIQRNIPDLSYLIRIFLDNCKWTIYHLERKRMGQGKDTLFRNGFFKNY